MEGSSVILLVSTPIRRTVRNFIKPVLPDLNVVAYSELTSDTEIKSLGTIGIPHEN